MLRLLPTLDFPDTDSGDFLARCYYTQTEEFLAVVHDEHGQVQDLAYAWQTAESMALEGSRVTVLWADGSYWDAARVQRLCDSSLAAYRDCYGLA